MSNFIVGITGGIGSGKTTIANMFADLGIDQVDADIVAREVVRPNSPALEKIIKYFDSSYLLNDGSLDRAKLRKKIFSDPLAKKWLNNLLHPLIRAAILAELSTKRSSYCLLVAPLLIENNLTQYVNRTLVVDVDEQTQLKRAMSRDNSSKALIENIMQSQLPRKKRLTVANDIIDNTVNLTKVRAQVEALHQLYVNLSKSTRC